MKKSALTKELKKVEKTSPNLKKTYKEYNNVQKKLREDQRESFGKSKNNDYMLYGTSYKAA